MILAIVMLVFGIIALSKGEFKITNKKKVKGSVGRALGVVLVVGAAGALVPDYGGIIQTITLVIVIIIGLATSEKIGSEPTEIDPQ